MNNFMKYQKRNTFFFDYDSNWNSVFQKRELVLILFLIVIKEVKKSEARRKEVRMTGRDSPNVWKAGGQGRLHSNPAT